MREDTEKIRFLYQQMSHIISLDYKYNSCPHPTLILMYCTSYYKCFICKIQFSYVKGLQTHWYERIASWNAESVRLFSNTDHLNMVIMQVLNTKVNVTMLRCFSKNKCVFLVLLHLFDLSVSPAEREKLSPSKLPLVKPVKVQPCRTPNTSASFLETHKLAKKQP